MEKYYYDFKSQNHNVLILVLLEDGLGVMKDLIIALKSAVLILVLLEDGLGGHAKENPMPSTD